MICSFCRHQNLEKGVKCCRNCKAELIRFIPLSKHEEDYNYRRNVRAVFLNKLTSGKSRITSIEKQEKQREQFKKQFISCFAEILSALNSSRL